MAIVNGSKQLTVVVLEIQSWIEQQNLSHPLTLTSLASSLNLSLSRVRHIFKAVTGISLSRYLKTYRLRAAQQLLVETYLSVKEIQALVGISDHSHFGRDYKRSFGETPLQTRSRTVLLNTRQLYKPLINQIRHNQSIDAAKMQD